MMRTLSAFSTNKTDGIRSIYPCSTYRNGPYWRMKMVFLYGRMMFVNGPYYVSVRSVQNYCTVRISFVYRDGLYTVVYGRTLSKYGCTCGTEEVHHYITCLQPYDSTPWWMFPSMHGHATLQIAIGNKNALPVVIIKAVLNFQIWNSKKRSNLRFY